MSGVIQQFPVEKEYEKNPGISSEDIRKLREWMKTQPHLPEQYWTDLDLIIAYHCCECSIEVAKQVIDLHISTRTLFKEIFQNRVIDKRIIDTLHVALLAPLPTSTVHGYRVMYCRLLDGDYRKYNLADMIRTFMMVFDLWQYEEGTWPGFVLIIDMDLVTLNHITKLDVTTIRSSLYFLQECMLAKVKEVHFTNAPSFMDKILGLLKPFIKNELIHILHAHEKKSEVLYEYIPKEAFPEECGGKYMTLESLRDHHIRRLQDNKEFFVRENLRRVNESLRQNGKTKTIEDVFGIQGNFKKLDID